MNLSIANQIINDNSDSCNNSFIDFLHEKSIFNEIKFWEFYNAIRFIGELNKTEPNLDRILTWKIVKSYEWFLLMLNFHFDTNDGCEIENLPENFSQFSIRLREVIDAYIKGNSISDESENYYNMELENPISLKLNN
jgi:hypothetical protein